jgi:hypothetical protein
MLIGSVLSSLGNLKLFGFEEKKRESIFVEPEEVETPPEPITMEKLKEVNAKSGMIYTCFPEARNKPEFSHLPESYYTLSPKEKLVLVFAENFRRQYKELFPKRRPLVLAVENECHVQKFVSTTIRPTAFIEFPELIDNWQACASFVADHIVYEALEDSTNIVSTQKVELEYFFCFQIFLYFFTFFTWFLFFCSFEKEFHQKSHLITCVNVFVCVCVHVSSCGYFLTQIFMSSSHVLQLFLFFKIKTIYFLHWNENFFI